MITLILKQRAFSLLDSYDICDTNGGLVYSVKSNFSLGRSMTVYDFLDNEVGTIDRRLLTFMPAYDITMNGHFAGTVRKEFTLLTTKFHIDYLGWRIEGDVFGWDYTIMNNRRVVASVEKKLMSFTDTYKLTVYDNNDMLAAVLLALTLDAEKDDTNKRR